VGRGRRAQGAGNWGTQTGDEEGAIRWLRCCRVPCDNITADVPRRGLSRGRSASTVRIRLVRLCSAQG
jgi:hypothetical protein